MLMGRYPEKKSLFESFRYSFYLSESFLFEQYGFSIAEDGEKEQPKRKCRNRMLAEENDPVSRLLFKPEWGIIVKKERPNSTYVTETDVKLG